MLERRTAPHHKSHEDDIRSSRRKVDGTMRGYRLFALGVLLSMLSLAPGCKSPGPPRTVVSPDPSLNPPAAAEADGPAVADATREVPPPRTVGWVERHPLFSKPRDYWDSSGNNTLVKFGAATFVGVPVGFYYEMKQIVAGVPPEPRF
jgi:hypothetical protein